MATWDYAYVGTWDYACGHMDPSNGVLKDPFKKSICRQKGSLPWQVAMGIDETELSKQVECGADTSLGLLP